VLYPALRRWGVVVTPLPRMGFGIAFSGFAWIAAGAIQLAIDGGDAISITWQVLHYVLLTFGGVLGSATALEFAYSQAPISMKGMIMAFWYLSVTVGNLLVLLANAPARNEAVISRVAEIGLTENASLMFTFAAFAIVAALAFGWCARRFPMQDHY
jgi:POT family proton-dependent oligopeptide transporter